MTCLITGASGFFGKALIEVLAQTKEERQFICLYNSNKWDICDPRFIWVQADLLDILCHQGLMEKYKPTHCIHLAWHVPPQNFWHAQENLEWLQASIYLFKAFCESGGRVFLGAGTLTEYDWSTGVLEEGKTPLLPNSLYGQCKKSLYEILKIIRASQYKDTVLIWSRIGYFFSVDEPSQKLISRLINSLITGAPLKLVDKNTKRPFAHVKYLGGFLANILLKQREDLVFNLSTTKTYALEEVVDFISSKLNTVPRNIAYGAYISPAREPLSIEIKTDILKGIFGNNIPDTFFDDLAEMIDIKLGRLPVLEGNKQKYTGVA